MKWKAMKQILQSSMLKAHTLLCRQVRGMLLGLGVLPDNVQTRSGQTILVRAQGCQYLNSVSGVC